MPAALLTRSGHRPGRFFIPRQGNRGEDGRNWQKIQENLNFTASFWGAMTLY
jgi:hypothetical protein